MARREAQADAAVKFSSHLDRMATSMANQDLSAVEIVELLRQDAEKWKTRGFHVLGTADRRLLCRLGVDGARG
ncbi:DUF2732 family protein [Serratia ureilytica]